MFFGPACLLASASAPACSSYYSLVSCLHIFQQFYLLMSFLWGKRSSDTDSGSRARHVADLVACFPSIRRPNNDDSSFEFSFEIDRNLNTLRVWLPSDFPSTKPMLQIVGPVQHPWLDQFKRVSGSEKVLCNQIAVVSVWTCQY